jgi:hypothetical protein
MQWYKLAQIGCWKSKSFHSFHFRSQFRCHKCQWYALGETAFAQHFNKCKNMSSWRITRRKWRSVTSCNCELKSTAPHRSDPQRTKQDSDNMSADTGAWTLGALLFRNAGSSIRRSFDCNLDVTDEKDLQLVHRSSKTDQQMPEYEWLARCLLQKLDEWIFLEG